MAFVFMDRDGFATRNFNIKSLSILLQALIQFLIWLRTLPSLNKQTISTNAFGIFRKQISTISYIVIKSILS
jgi:hypothetical protein